MSAMKGRQVFQEIKGSIWGEKEGAKKRDQKEIGVVYLRGPDAHEI